MKSDDEKKKRDNENSLAFLVMVVAILAALFGCGGCDTQDRTKAINAQRLAMDGELMGKLSDGREVRRWEIETPYGPNHWIYVVGNTTTMNYTKPATDEGDTPKHQVEVTTLPDLPSEK